jgi:hypothetical protein
VHPDVDELRPKLKEILYDCAVEIRATKAALYLIDAASNRFELATEYGFKVPLRASIDRNDPVIDRCGRGRTPFFINGLTVEPRFSELLYAAQSERILAAPVYMRGTMVGVVDMRDKAQKQAFDQADVQKAQRIADRISELFANKNPFNLRIIALSEADGATEITNLSGVSTSSAPRAQIDDLPKNLPQVMPRPAAPPASAPVAVAAPPPPKPERQQVRAPVGHLATLILEARTASQDVLVPTSQSTLTDEELTAAREVLKATLLIPYATAAMLSAFGRVGGIQEIAAKSALNEDGVRLMQSKLNVWLTKRGESVGALRTTVQTPFGSGDGRITASQLQKVFTAPVNVHGTRRVYFTVAFDGAPDRTTHDAMASNLNYLQVAIEHATERSALTSIRSNVAEKLLEPDFTRYPELRQHTAAVVACVARFLEHLSLDAVEAENVRLAAIVHDVGMRLLDYGRLYRKADMSPEEVYLLREHVTIGAALVAPLLGNDVARAVLCHHERVDGRGYPNELHGDEIPLASRIVQICDSWVAMTDPHTYQPLETKDNALAILTRGAGSQFDAELVNKFVEVFRN